jgi:hypothetical protein
VPRSIQTTITEYYTYLWLHGKIKVSNGSL